MALNKNVLLTDGGLQSNANRNNYTAQIVDPNSGYKKNPASRQEAYANSIAGTGGSIDNPNSAAIQANLNAASQSGSSGGGASYAAPVVDNSANNALLQAISAYQAALEAQRAQMEANYQAALGNLKAARDQNASNLKSSADDAKRQAYIDYMLGKRNLNQQLSNAGINGGATESVNANMFNTYGNNRNNIDNSYLQSLGDLDAKYNEGVANLGANYGSDTAGVVSNYYNTIAGLQANYAADLAKQLGKSQASYGTTLSQADDTNAKNAITALKSADGNPSSIRSILNLYGYDFDSNEGKQLIAQAGYDPYQLMSTASPVSPSGAGISSASGNSISTGVSLNSIPGAANMQRALQNAYNVGGMDGAANFADSLRSQGYSEAVIKALIESLGL